MLDRTSILIVSELLGERFRSERVIGSTCFTIRTKPKRQGPAQYTTSEVISPARFAAEWIPQQGTIPECVVGIVITWADWCRGIERREHSRQLDTGQQPYRRIGEERSGNDVPLLTLITDFDETLLRLGPSSGNLPPDRSCFGEQSSLNVVPKQLVRPICKRGSNYVSVSVILVPHGAFLRAVIESQLRRTRLGTRNGFAFFIQPTK